MVEVTPVLRCDGCLEFHERAVRLAIAKRGNRDMKVLIIGNAVGHEVQKEIVDHDSLADEKQRFRAFLEERILQHRAEFIAEETLPNTRTIANQLGIPWANIDMPQEIREALGIAKEQNSRGQGSRISRRRRKIRIN